MMIEKELKMYGMFSEAGEVAVAGIVSYHKAIGSPWSLVVKNLEDLAKYDYDKFGEATDTVVRECVYTEIFGE